jgi:mRNA-degrading endonuclease toxin of MazEF toxin-antitoxin module
MNRGDVVLVDWQFSDRTGSKKRPAIVIQADFLNQLIDDTVLVQITGPAMPQRISCGRLSLATGRSSWPLANAATGQRSSAGVFKRDVPCRP